MLQNFHPSKAPYLVAGRGRSTAPRPLCIVLWPRCGASTSTLISEKVCAIQRPAAAGLKRGTGMGHGFLRRAPPCVGIVGLEMGIPMPVFLQVGRRTPTSKPIGIGQLDVETIGFSNPNLKHHTPKDELHELAATWAVVLRLLLNRCEVPKPIVSLEITFSPCV